MTAMSDPKEIFDFLVIHLQPKHSQILRRMPYEIFLQTDYWKIIKQRVLWESCKCSQCGSWKNLQIHHKTYEHRGYEHLHLEDLQVLCKDCHELVHKDETPKPILIKFLQRLTCRADWDVYEQYWKTLLPKNPPFFMHLLNKLAEARHRGYWPK